MQLEGIAGLGEIRPLACEPRRVLFFGKSMSRTRATFGLVEALREHGLQVKWLNMATLRRWLGRRAALAQARRLFRRYQPDLVFGFCRDLPRELVDEFREAAKILLWIEEPLREITAEYVEYLAKAHAVFMTNPSKFDWLRQQGIEHLAFSLEGFSDSYHYAIPARAAKRDLVFIGGPGYEGQRAQFLAEIARHYPVEIYGHGWRPWLHRFPNLVVRPPVKARAYRRLCAESRIVLGMNQVNDDPLYFSNRTILSLACRGFHLTHYVPGLERVFADGEHLAWFRDRDHCLEQIESYLRRPIDRAQIARAGHDLVHRSHRFSARIAHILEVLRGRPATTWAAMELLPGMGGMPGQSLPAASAME